MRSVNVPGDPAFTRFGIDSAREFPAASRHLVTSGQIGDPTADMPGQLAGALDAVDLVLRAGGYRFDNVARMTIYTTDVDAFVASYAVLRTRFEPGTVPPHTVVPVPRLVRPGCVIEVEVQAVH